MSTIAAISTPQGKGALSVVRLSGDCSVSIADKIFSGKEKLCNVKSHTIHYGHIVCDSVVLDEVLVSVMKAPRTFTREDVVEISCHGGVVCAKNVLQALLCLGAELADAGEFTRRAFINGRIDLSQAEAVIDVINAYTNLQGSIALSQLDGNLSGAVDKLRKKISDICVHIQAAADFPEEVDDIDNQLLCKSLEQISDEIYQILNTFDKGKIIRDGVSTAIIGKPNVGKSSILNKLCGQDCAIVTNIPGTTRDAIEQYINLKGVVLKIIDTAGIRSAGDEIEKIGVEKSKKIMEYADLVIFAVDGSRPADDNDFDIANALKDRKCIVAVNKSDLDKELDLSFLDRFNIVFVSAKTGMGMSELQDGICDLFFNDITSDTVVTNVRHKNCLERAKDSIKLCIDTLKNGIAVDMVYVDASNAVRALGEILGDNVTEDIIDEIFKKFCVGK